MNLWNFAGKFYLTINLKAQCLAPKKVDKALYLEIDLKVATQKLKRSGLVVREHLFLLALLNILKR